MHVQFVSATISQLTVIMKGEVLQISLLLLLLKIGLMSASAAFEVLKVASECVKITFKCLETYSVLIRHQCLNPTVECILLSERKEESSCSYFQLNLLYLD